MSKRYSKAQARDLKAFISDKITFGLKWPEISDALNETQLKPANGDVWNPHKLAQFANRKKLFIYGKNKKSTSPRVTQLPLALPNFSKPEIKSESDASMLRNVILDAVIDSDTKIRMLKNLENR